MNIVTDRSEWASGVLIRAIALPQENERIAAGPALVTRRFGLDRSYDNMFISVENGLWLTKRAPSITMQHIVCTTRIGISKAHQLPWRWYLKNSRSVSKRVKGDYSPKRNKAWYPDSEDIL